MVLHGLDRTNSSIGHVKASKLNQLLRFVRLYDHSNTKTRRCQTQEHLSSRHQTGESFSRAPRIARMPESPRRVRSETPHACRLCCRANTPHARRWGRRTDAPGSSVGAVSLGRRREERAALAHRHGGKHRSGHAELRLHERRRRSNAVRLPVVAPRLVLWSCRFAQVEHHCRGRMPSFPALRPGREAPRVRPRYCGSLLVSVEAMHLHGAQGIISSGQAGLTGGVAPTRCWRTFAGVHAEGSTGVGGDCCTTVTAAQSQCWCARWQMRSAGWGRAVRRGGPT